MQSRDSTNHSSSTCTLPAALHFPMETTSVHMIFAYRAKQLNYTCTHTLINLYNVTLFSAMDYVMYIFCIFC